MTNQTQGHTKPKEESINYILNNAVANIYGREKLGSDDRKALELISSGYISKCVNSHEDLLEALKDLVDTCEMNAFISSTKSFDKAKQAIAKAEGKN